MCVSRAVMASWRLGAAAPRTRKEASVNGGQRPEEAGRGEAEGGACLEAAAGRAAAGNGAWEAVARLGRLRSAAAFGAR